MRQYERYKRVTKMAVARIKKQSENQSGSLHDLWQSYANEIEKQLQRIAEVRAVFNKIPNAQHSSKGYKLRSQFSTMYCQLEELRETERKLRVYYQFSGQTLSEKNQRAELAARCA